MFSVLKGLLTPRDHGVFFWKKSTLTLKNPEKNSCFGPFSKVKDDHPGVANCPVY